MAHAAISDPASRVCVNHRCIMALRKQEPVRPRHGHSEPSVLVVDHVPAESMGLVACQYHDACDSRSQLLEMEDCMIIGICGAPGSGKGEAAKVLIKRGFANGKFSHALKEMFRTLLRYRGFGEDTIERMIDGDLKEVPCPQLCGKTPRHAMQTLGMWGRNDIDKDIWVDTEFDAQWAQENLVFDDVRAANEEKAIQKKGGVVIQITGRVGSESNHDLEKFIPNNPVAVIENGGTLAELREKVDQLAIDLSWSMAA